MASPPRRILYIQYTNPAAYPPLEHSSHLLAEAGWQVLFLGTGAQGEADRLTFIPHPAIRVRRMAFARAGWRQKLHYAWFCLWVIVWWLRWRPDWVYASESLVTPVALILTYLPRARVLYHEHDAPGAPTSAFMRWIARARTRLARRADLIVIPNQQRGDHFRRETGTTRPIQIVWNCPRRGDAKMLYSGGDHSRLRILFQGSIVPDRLPLTVIEAIARVPDTELHIVGYQTIGHKNYVNAMLERAAQLGARERVVFHGALPTRADLFTVTRDCDVGLALMPASGDLNMANMQGASNKPFDYMACGMTLLVSDLPAWRAMFVDNGYAIAVDPNDTGSLAAAIRWYADHPAERARMGEAGRQRIWGDWNYETQFAPLFITLNLNDKERLPA